MNRNLKLLITGITAVLILGTLFGCGSGRKNLDELAHDGNELRVYEVFGMDCPGCHGGLENLIDKIPGVIASQANWKKQELQVVIESDSAVTDQLINDAIRKANFTPGKRLR
jgi:copper chaperone CopZ